MTLKECVQQVSATELLLWAEAQPSGSPYKEVLQKVQVRSEVEEQKALGEAHKGFGVKRVIKSVTG